MENIESIATKAFKVLEQLHGPQQAYKRKDIIDVLMSDCDITEKESYKVIDSLERKPHLGRGKYAFPQNYLGDEAAGEDAPNQTDAKVDKEEHKVAADDGEDVAAETDFSPTRSYVPKKFKGFVSFGFFSKMKAIIESNEFFPVYISGDSGNGKTLMVQQACACANREIIRVQINPCTDEDDLIGGFRLKTGGEMVFVKGPVISAMERGAVLLIDEIDRGNNNIMALQGILEGSPYLIKKTGEIIYPKKGFTVVATANTKGSGDERGKYSAAQLIDDAFRERFVIDVEQDFPSDAVERKIIKQVNNFHGAHLTDHNLDHLVAWSKTIREAYENESAEAFISTRRLVHIVRTNGIFDNLRTSMELCLNKFDKETQEVFFDIFEKVEPVQEEEEDFDEGSDEDSDKKVDDFLGTF